MGSPVTTVGVDAVSHVPSSDGLPWSAGSFSTGFGYSVQNYILGAEITPYQISVLLKDGAAWLNVTLCRAGGSSPTAQDRVCLLGSVSRMQEGDS